MQKKQIYTLVFLFVCTSLSAQTLKKFLQYGDAEMQKGNYYTAAQYYKQGAEKYENNLLLKNKLADAYRNFNDYENAADLYSAVVAEDLKKEYTLAPYWAGIMYQRQGEYDKAINFFKKYKIRNKTDDVYTKKAENQIQSCLWAKQHLLKQNKDTLVNIGDSINTSFAEFNAFSDAEGNLYFSSIREKNEKADSSVFLSLIYKYDDKKHTTVLRFKNSEAEMHIANGVFSLDQKKMYFTQCVTNQQNKFSCQLYKSTFEDATWSQPEKLDPKINLDEYTTTQPAIGRDSRGNELLYYVSDRVGGEGKFDIWCAKINADGSFENPINLGKKINTEEDEITPFYDAENDSFYFSSNYHYGFGGYDVFKTKGSYNNWSEPENLGYTINSPANDLYYSKSAVTNTIYLTSNRKGSKFLKAATCCNDIYYKKGIDSLPKIIKKDSAIITENKTKIDSSSLAILKKDTFISPPQIINTTLKNIQQLLPVTLYFHNDEPECCNMRDTTALTYSKTYEAYWRLKPTYEKETDKKIIDDFFAEKVDEGYRKLIQFSAQLLDLLNAGNAVEVEIQGYCSPLNFNEYNIHLGNRRVASLKNHFTEYRNNIFQSFIDNKKLILKEKSFGEETADQKISDDREDKKRSVYDVAAATERRVQIISVIIK